MISNARSKNLTLLHQNNQIQNIKTTTCTYFCLYFLNELSKGTTYYGLLRVFDIHDKMKNEQFIEKYFKIFLKKNSSYVSGLICQWCQRIYLCGFVSLYVRMFVARANNVEGTMS